MAAEAATNRPVAHQGMMFEYGRFKQRALDLLRRSKDPMRCMEQMRAKVRVFLGQNFGEIKEDLVEKGGGLVSSCQEYSAIQLKGLKEELVEQKGDQTFDVTARQFEDQCFDLKDQQSVGAAVVQEIQEDLNGSVLPSEKVQVHSEQMQTSVFLMNQAYRKGWRAELSLRIYANCCRMKGLMQLQGHLLLSCASPGHIFLQQNTTQKAKIKKCITKRVKMKQSKQYVQPAGYNVLQYVDFQDGFEEVEKAGADGADQELPEQVKILRLHLAKQLAECSLVQQGEILVERRLQVGTIEDDGVENMNEAASLEEGRRA